MHWETVGPVEDMGYTLEVRLQVGTWRHIGTYGSFEMARWSFQESRYFGNKYAEARISTEPVQVWNLDMEAERSR